MRYGKQNSGGGERENHIETPSLFIHPLVDTVSLSSGIPSVYSRKSRTRSIRDGELPSTSTSPSSTPDHESTAVPLQQSYLWGRPGQGARQQRASRRSNLAASSPVASCSHPGPGPSAVPSSPVSSPASIIRWRETATREVLLLLFRRIEIPRRASWINPMPGWVVGISLNSPHWHARVARRPGPSRRGRKYRGKLQSRLGCRSSWSPCRAGFFPFPSLLSPPKSKRNTHNTSPKKNLRRKHPTDHTITPKASPTLPPCIQTATHTCIIPVTTPASNPVQPTHSSTSGFPTATTADPSNAASHKRSLLGPSRPGEALYSVAAAGLQMLGGWQVAAGPDNVVTSSLFLADSPGVGGLWFNGTVNTRVGGKRCLAGWDGEKTPPCRRLFGTWRSASPIQIGKGSGAATAVPVSRCERRLARRWTPYFSYFLLVSLSSATDHHSKVLSSRCLSRAVTELGGRGNIS